MDEEDLPPSLENKRAKVEGDAVPVDEEDSPVVTPLIRLDPSPEILSDREIVSTLFCSNGWNSTMMILHHYYYRHI